MATHALESRRQDFYARIASKGLTPLWLNMSALVSAAPNSRCKPVSWRFDDIRASIIEAGALIAAEEADPTTGDWAMPTIAVFMQLLPQGFASSPYRSTDGAIFAVVEGHGHSLIAGRRFDWREKDIFVAPSWHSVQHFPAGEAILFSYSDRATQEKLGFWRERRGDC